MGKAFMSGALVLYDVLYIPTFRLNLISVNRLCASSSLQLLFTSSSCYLQDPKGKRTTADGKLVGTLYILNTGMLNSMTGSEGKGIEDRLSAHLSSTSFINVNNIASPIISDHRVDTDLWHGQLGHASITTMHHISFWQIKSYMIFQIAIYVL